MHYCTAPCAGRIQCTACAWCTIDLMVAFLARADPLVKAGPRGPPPTAAQGLDKGVGPSFLLTMRLMAQAGTETYELAAMQTPFRPKLLEVPT